MKKPKGDFTLFVFIGMAFCLLLAQLYMHQNVRLYGDDWHYFDYVRRGVKAFFIAQYDHYRLVNGRAIVHLLITIFLGLPMWVWRLVNSLFILSIAVIGSLISINKDARYRASLLYGMVIMTLSISAIDHGMAEQSIYWLTGSFNYLYPLWLFFVFAYVYSIKARYQATPTVILIGFLAAATVEQSAMMTLGMIVLNLLWYVYINNDVSHYGILGNLKLIHKRQWLLLMVVLIGAMSVIVAPSVFVRVTLEKNEAGKGLALILANIVFQGNMFFTSRPMAPVHILTMVAAGAVIQSKLAGKNKKLSLRTWLLMPIFMIGVFGFILNHIARFEMIGDMRIVQNILSKPPLMQVALLCYLAMLFYAAWVVMVENLIGHAGLPMIFLILGIGTVMMMLVSPIFGFRNLIFAYFMLVMYSAMLLQKFMDYRRILLVCCGLSFLYDFYGLCMVGLLFWGVAYFMKNDYGNYQKVLTLIAVAVICGAMYGDDYGPYSANRMSYDLNLRLAEKHKEALENSGDADMDSMLTQYELPYRYFRWAMPYDNHYYDGYYKAYLGVPKTVKINWVQGQ